jgi:hypothetical protein
MRNILLAAFVGGLWLAPGLSAQQPLPERFGSWAASGPSAGVAPAVAGKQPGEAVAVLTEAGLVSVSRRLYTSGSHSLALTLYQLRDSSGAVAAFTYVRARGMISSDLGIRAALARDRGILLSGSAVVEAEGLANVTTADLRALAATLARAADKTPPPPIPGYLPLTGRLPGSDRYIVGVAGFRAAAAELSRPELTALAEKVGFNAGAEAALARYRDGRGETALLLIEYPTPQFAGLHQKHLEAALASSAQPGGLSIRRKGSLLSVVLPGTSAATARALLDGVRFETDLTWNEPSQTATDPPWATTIVKTFVGTGVFLLAAFVFGIAFGGVRVITKLFFPGKVFDRRERMQILQLGLASKPIDADDFYASWNPRASSGR